MRWIPLLLTILWAVPTFGGLATSQAATLTDFGFENMTRNGVTAIGSHPLLLAVVEFEEVAPLSHEIDYYHDFFFDHLRRDTVNGFIYENSNQRFRWDPASPQPIYLKLPVTEIMDSLNIVHGEEGDEYWFNNILDHIANENLFDFAPYDGNGNGVVTYDELGFFVISNDRSSIGLARSSLLVEGPVVDIDMHATAASMEQDYFQGELDINVTAHESLHILGTLDIYGACGFSVDLSLMGAAGPRTDRTDIYHLDPWHKLQLGWVEPRIRSLLTSGVESLVPPQAGEVDAPVLLHDPEIGIDEFFLVEYRTRMSPWENEYDKNVAGNGLVLWQVAQTAGHGPQVIPCPCDSTKDCRTIFSRGAPHLMVGGNQVWGSEETTPPLLWLDEDKPIPSPNTITVGPFSATDSSLVVSWARSEWQWVDFDYVGPEAGTFYEPFNTLAEGVSAAGAGTTVKIKSGSTPEIPTISSAVILESYGGAAIVGKE